jgi:SET domain-containing protein
MSKKLIDNLHNTYVRIMPSKIHGVGLFAIKDIPKGICPFEYPNSKCGINKFTRIHKDKLEGIDKGVIKILDDFLGIDEKGYYDIPTDGLNSLDVSFYMNFSKKPNIDITSFKECKFAVFITNRNIKKGEELFINYNKF